MNFLIVLLKNTQLLLSESGPEKTTKLEQPIFSPFLDGLVLPENQELLKRGLHDIGIACVGKES